MLVLAFLRVPLGAAMGFVGFVGLIVMRNLHVAVASMTATVVDMTTSYTLVVIPLFVVMGNLVTRAGMSSDLYNAAYTWIGHRKGGLAMATIFACAGFGAICGSAIATAATMSRVAHPSMKRQNYSDSLAAGAIASGGTLGILIPPSTMMIIYCILTQQNISKMFSAGLLPALLAIGMYLLAIRFTIWRQPDSGPPGERSGWFKRFQALLQIWEVILLFAVVMGGMYGGVFTTTEASAVGAAGALILAIFKARLSFGDLLDVFTETARTTAMLFAILIGALVFSSFLNFTSLPYDLQGFVSGLVVPPIIVICLICVLYIFLGMFLEELSVILLTVPLFFPVVVALGFDPIWFGILVVCVVEIGMISPPVGMNIFVINSMLPSVPTREIWKGVLPFFVADVIRLAILIAVPGLSLFLPRLLFGG